MRFLYDRMYGRLEFPKIVDNLVDCPGLLRLRHIGMANVEFFAFPSFSSVTRYEHSLGVCHLAEIAAKSLELDPRSKYELMIAALYHDVTTPPFAHATEEFLKDQYGFDHESRFGKLVTGTSSDTGRSDTQIFEGHALKLPRYAKTAAFRKYKIDLYKIPKLVFGDTSEPLANLISGDIDLDNIDNVVRAASAMGLAEATGELAETLAGSFVRTIDNKIGISASAEPAIQKWMWLRSHLYDMIFCSVDDFALQTMLKYCLRLLADSDDPNITLSEEDWKLTEPQIISRMNELPECAKVLRGMHLRRLFPCLGLLWLSGPKSVSYIMKESNRKVLETLAREKINSPVVCNFYVDKRQRPLRREFVLSDGGFPFHKEISSEEGILIGFFATETVSSVVENNGERIVVPFCHRVGEFLKEIASEMPSDVRVHNVQPIMGDRFPSLKRGKQLQ